MQHLNDEQLSAAIMGEADEHAVAHLASCAACRAEADSLARTFGGIRAMAEAQAARPEGFWYAQRAAVAGQLGGHGFTRPRLMVWAGALAVLTLAASLLAQAPRIDSARLNAAAIETIDDHELLMDVERSVQRTVPRALEPASALAQEMAQAYSENSATKSGDDPNGSP